MTTLADPTSDITTIALKHGTDKASAHSYMSVYQELMEPHRLRPITILELGVEEGNSIRTWLEFFPHAKIVGVDIDLSRVPEELLREKRFHPFEFDVRDSGQLMTLSRIIGDAFFIIDDVGMNGVHDIKSQLLCFAFLAKNCTGFYIVEDIRHSEHGSYFLAHGGDILDWSLESGRDDDRMWIKDFS